MTLGRTSSGAIKIKTDGGLRAVGCACCNCQELGVRPLRPLIEGTSIDDLWNISKLNHFWKTRYRMQGYITLPSELLSTTVPFVVTNEPICLYLGEGSQVNFDGRVPEELYLPAVGTWSVRVGSGYTSSELIDGNNVYYGVYQDNETSNSWTSPLISISVTVNIRVKRPAGQPAIASSTRWCRFNYVSAIANLPFFNFEPFYRADILPVVPQVMLNPIKPELGDYTFHRYALVGTRRDGVYQDGGVYEPGGWSYGEEYPTITVTSFTQF
jgi:hypothetical protein